MSHYHIPSFQHFWIISRKYTYGSEQVHYPIISLQAASWPKFAAKYTQTHKTTFDNSRDETSDKAPIKEQKSKQKFSMQSNVGLPIRTRSRSPWIPSVRAFAALIAVRGEFKMIEEGLLTRTGGVIIGVRIIGTIVVGLIVVRFSS